MNVTRKTWVSAGIVSLVLAGGISVTAAAASGGIGRAEKPSGEPVPVAPHEPGRSSQEPSPTASAPPAEEYVVSRDVNPDPGKVVEYWSENRLEEAEPFPMPMVDDPVLEGSSGSAEEGPVEVLE
ncbi:MULTISPECIES: hypothetical protein [unclassified Streptosporangium]|uniref:hypothetical protein n=1 Tax=unclassified Streptosporangium TaxID=2632669 RepID=UPI002E2C9652|nr:MULTISPECIES: hypothetical protein [unclassified Streptosporangium]